MITKDSLDEPILKHVRNDFVALRENLTVQQALDLIRGSGNENNILYFYAVNDAGRLVGVVPTRKLLMSPLTTHVTAIMTPNVLAIPDAFTVLDACEFFVLHRFLAFPVVSRDRRILGVVDVTLFQAEMFKIHEREELDGLFETLGFRISQLRDGSVWRGFRLRLPWLLATIASGTACAFFVGQFEATLAKCLLLTFFLTLVLGLSESMSVQTMTVTIHTLRHRAPDWGWYVDAIRRDILRNLAMASAAALLVACTAFLWKRELTPALVIAGGIFAALLTAGFLGITVPAVVHRLKLDLTVASGPFVLALTDICTILLYFTIARLVIGQ